MGGPKAETKPRCVICHASYARAERFCPLDGGAVVEEDDSGQDALLGKTIDGRYLVRRLLGRGGMGAVYEADHIGLDKRVAIKFVSNANANRDQLARFRQEARAASRIVHEHVVQIYDVGVDSEGLDFIVMEYVDGRDLQSVLKAGALEPVRAISITRQILHGLHASHAAGIIHRDIKPANILLTSAEGSVKIMDFGIAKSIDADVAQTDTGTGRVIGTPQYMAPEQLADAEVDHRADLYSVGATLFAMLTGHNPFPGTSFTERSESLLRPAPSLETLRPGLPPALVAAVARALERSPSDRFDDALDFAEALGSADVLSDAAVAPRFAAAGASATGTMRRAPLSSREIATERALRLDHVASEPASAGRRRWPMAVAIALLGFAVAVAVYFLRSPDTGIPDRPAVGVATASEASVPLIDKLAFARSAEQRGELALALAAYQEAYAASPAADPLFRIADLYERLGDRERAAAYLRRYLEAAPQASDREVVLVRIARLARGAGDAGVTAADASDPVRVTRSPEQDRVATGTPCECKIETAEGWTTNACKSKLRAPSCECRDAERNGLCPVAYTVTGSDDSPLPDGTTGGVIHCVDRTRSDCAPRSGMPASCVLGRSWNGTSGQPCRGYARGQRPSDSPVAGIYECDLCDWAPSAPKYRGKAGEPCTGYTGSDGKRYSGILTACATGP
ncbi:MAG: protein kinase [Deltaproteobacteria bacterium]|nr:protein kinase [Deltaproteobacteria bacterium]